MKKMTATLSVTNRKVDGKGGVVVAEEAFEVELMAVAGGYAMVRRSGAAPFIVDFMALKDIK